MAKAVDAVFQSALIDKAEREAEAEKENNEDVGPIDWSSMGAKNMEHTRALRKKLELQQKLKAKQAAERTEPTEVDEEAAKELQREQVAEAIRSIEDSSEPKPKGPTVKLGQKMLVTSEGDMSKEESMRLQSLVGAGKCGKLKAFFQLTDQKREIDDSEVNPDEVISFSGCKDCDYTVTAMCTKIFVERCENLILRLQGKIITHTVEMDACEKVNLLLYTKIGTLQVERCSKMNLLIQDRADFAGGFMIWAGCFMTRLQVEDLVMSCDFGLTQKLDPTINLERTQFKVWLNSQGKLTCDKVIRLVNGFPSTKREDDEHTRRQEALVDGLAKRMGVTVHRKESAIGCRVKPNEPCPCGSGQKYKKCCLNGATRLIAQQTDPLPTNAGG